VTGTDLFREAAAELYSSDPDTFIERRGALVARARQAGQAPAAKRIAGLRKPTRSAWVLNRLVRAEPGVPGELAGLGQELRAAQRSLDGTAIRELSLRRRQLIDALARQAFTVSGLHAPPAALRDEVTATLGAALADPEVAEKLAAGTLERAARSEGFGPGAPTLTLVTSSGSRRPLRAVPASGAPRAPGTPGTLAVAGAGARARSAVKAAPPAAAAPGAERERRRQAAIAAAEQAVADAARAAEAATAAEQDAERAVQALEERLADARRSLSDTRAQARRARARQRQARQALDRLRR
jgi:hypothetical protein